MYSMPTIKTPERNDGPSRSCLLTLILFNHLLQFPFFTLSILLSDWIDQHKLVLRVVLWKICSGNKYKIFSNHREGFSLSKSVDQKPVLKNNSFTTIFQIFSQTLIWFFFKKQLFRGVLSKEVLFKFLIKSQVCYRPVILKNICKRLFFCFFYCYLTPFLY